MICIVLTDDQTGYESYCDCDNGSHGGEILVRDGVQQLNTTPTKCKHYYQKNIDKNLTRYVLIFL